MKILKGFTCLPLVIIFTIISPGAVAQQKRKPASKAPQKTPANLVTPTFDTLIAANSYKIYGEVRGVGQLIRSSSMKELLEPIMKLAGPPKEFKTLMKWLEANANEVMTSRMLVAGWPTAEDLPEVLVAIEFATAEDAAKFEPKLNGFLPKVLPTTAPVTSSSSKASGEADKEKDKETGPPEPNYYTKQVGALILIARKPLVLNKLRPRGSKLLTEDANFQVARNRFNAETIFLFINVKGIEKAEEDRRKQSEEEMKKLAAEAANQPATPASSEEAREQSNGEEPEEQPKEPSLPESAEPQATNATILGEQKQPPPPDPVSTALTMLTGSFFSGQSKWPEGIGVGVGLENDSLDVRALMVSAPGEKSDAVPFFPRIIPGAALVPESPSILPGDTELFVTMSLDLQQIYASMTKPDQSPEPGRIQMQTIRETERESPFAALENQLKIKIKDDLLPLLDSEIVLSLPVKELTVGPPSGTSTPKPNPDNENAASLETLKSPSPVLAISLRDREGMRALLPKIVEAVGFKGASALAQTERKEDTEIVSYANAFSYAFVGNFLLFSGDVATTRHVVDSYLKHETLSADMKFKNYTRWQPRQLQGQVYVSPALMESYKTWADQPTSLFSDQTREFLMGLSVIAQPITYTLSNEGLGTLHEVHIPKNLVVMALAGISSEANPPPIVANERSTISALYMIAGAEQQFRSEKGAGSYGTLDQLVAEGLISKESLEEHGYKLELTAAGAKFEVSAVPIEYGRTGRLSYFTDESKVVRAGDHGGGPATGGDRPLQ
jgi:hypothetical protein